MKKLSVFVVCLLLAVSMMAVPVLAAETTGYVASPGQPAAPTDPTEPAAPVKPELPVDNSNSSVEIDGVVIQGDKLEDAGYKLVADDAVLDEKAMESAPEEVKAAYTEVTTKPVNELKFADGGKELEKQVKQSGLELDKLGVANLINVTVQKTDDPTATVSSEKVTVTVKVPYASKVKLVLHQLPDGTWKVMKFKVNLANKNGNGSFDEDSITLDEGGTGVYVFLTDEETLDEITGGKYDRENLFN